MNINSAIRRMIPVGAAVLGGVAILLWFKVGAGGQFTERVPGSDGAVESSGGGKAGVWQGKLTKSNGVPASLSGVWGQFRGPRRDGINTESIPLAKTWPATGPKVLWKMDIGEGFAGGAIWNGRVFLLDYDSENRADILRSLSLTDGQEIWRYGYPSKIKRNHGMSRTVPTVSEKFSISLGPKCNVVCLDPVSGELRWQIDMVSAFGTAVPNWYAGQCPFVDGDKLILGAGGPEALVVAVDCATGKVLWKSPNPKNWAMTHSSVVPMDFNGRHMYLYCASGGVAAVSADTGEILWLYPDWKISFANIPCPTVVGADRIFFTGGYNAGSLMLQVKEEAGKLAVTPLFKLSPNVFGATQHTPVLYHDHFFGVRADGQLVCLDLDGKIAWESGSAHKFGNGPFLIAQDMIFVMNDSGVLTLAEASVQSYKELAQAKVLEGPDAWAPMALADGRLVLRDMTQMVCVDVRAE